MRETRSREIACNTSSKVICGVCDDVFFGFVLNVSKINTVIRVTGCIMKEGARQTEAVDEEKPTKSGYLSQGNEK